MPGVRIPLWLPIRSLGSINVYVFEEDDGITLIDAGMLSGRSILDLVWGLKNLGYTLCNIKRVILTHFHVDHSSLASILVPCGTEIIMSKQDASVITEEVRNFIEAATNLFKNHGVPDHEIEAMLKNHPALRLEYAYSRLKEATISTVEDGDNIQVGVKELEVVLTPGHTPGSMVLLDREENAIYSGDTILPGITPHITLHDPHSDPLGDYLNSLKKIIKLSPSKAYPGHRNPIDDPVKRAKELLKHHDERLNEIVDIIKRAGQITAYEIAKKVRWRTRYNDWSEYPPQEKFFAMGETLAHLRRLEVEGRVEKFEANGLVYWRANY
ncbi:MAG: MBL fold metallo-hydrolase [Desulfurococcales archaeon]|nr:MBL fold metallo-hydrolase [Desulfurococcales archaeon]